MASVRKRAWKKPDGTMAWSWEVSWNDGEKRRRKSTFKTKAAADAYAVNIQKEVNDGAVRPKGHRMTLKVLSEEYLQDVDSRADRQAIGKGHRRNEHAHFRNYICRDPNFNGSKMGRQIKPFDKGIGHLPIAKIMPSTVIRFRDNLFAVGLSHTAVRAHIISLHLALEHARLRDYVPFNAADKIKVETPRKEKEKRVTPPSPAAIKEVLATAPEEFCFIIEFSACTGLRAGELRPLRYKHIDFEKRVVKVKVALDVDDIEGPPKSKAGYREIPLSATLLDRLRARKEAAGAGRMSLVFPNEKGRYIYRGALLRELNRLTAALGWIKPGELDLDVDEDDEEDANRRFTWHSLRHYAISSWIAAGFGLKAVQTYAGHADISTTVDRYGHLFPDEDRWNKMDIASASVFGR